MSNSSGRFDVLVAGAGPVGLTAAYELTRRGLRVRVVDQAAGPATTSRALATHARTLEIYDQMGLLDRILPRGQRVEHFTLHSRGRQLIRFDTDYSQLPTRFPFTLMVDQVITEEVLRDAVQAVGVEIEWGVRLEEFNQDDDGVYVALRHPDGEVRRSIVSWLVGCDGGRSTVRKSLGLKLIGESSETWLIADAVVDIDLPDDSIHWMHTGNGTVMLVPFPEPGKWRLLDTVDIGYEDDAATVGARFAAKISKATGKPATVRTPSWVSVFTIQQRMVPDMRVGRCFVAGDAAHVHSPASGQGMNTGIQDAYNLAWKLAMVVRGQADARLLDSYAVERVPIGAALLGSTRTATTLVALRNSVLPAVMPIGLAVIRRLRQAKSQIERKIMRGMAGLALSYRPAPGQPGGPAPAVDPANSLGSGARPGERVSLVRREDLASPGCAALVEELRDPRWSLLVFGAGASTGAVAGAAAAHLHREHAEWLSVRIVGDWLDSAPTRLDDPDGRLAEVLGARPGSWLLVRPDGYLAARGTDLRSSTLDGVLDTVGVNPEPVPAEDVEEYVPAPLLYLPII
ncbi:MAG: oxygenase [Actinobacteria bacterium 13_2_20CM_2_71_6]|nr:MAG: oxygenase [Actinobacteria bacterium 13_2_20CM_2_71_6]